MGAIRPQCLEPLIRVPFPTHLRSVAENVVEASWMGSLLLVPVLFNTTSSQVFEPDKQGLLRALAVVMAAAWLVGRIEAGWRTASGARLHRPGVPPLAWPVLAFVVASSIATLLSLQPATSVFGSYERRQGLLALLSGAVLFGVLATRLASPTRRERLLDVVLLAAVPVAGYALLQRAGADPLAWNTDFTARAASTQGNPIFLGGYLAMVALLAIERCRRALARRQADGLGPVAAHAAIVALVLTAFAVADSRGPQVAFFAALAAYALYHAPRTAEAAGGASRLTAPDLMRAVGLALALAGIAGAVVLAGRAGVHTPAGQRLGAAGVLVPVIVFLPIVVLGEWLPGARRWAWAALPVLGLFAILGVGAMAWRGSGMFADGAAAGGSVRARVLIWEGARDLVLPHAPLRDASGAPDRFAAVRPFVGYGPETFSLAFHPFYAPELAHLDSRDSLPDRAHNDGWDTLATTGLLGFAARQWLLVAVLAWGLAAAGVVRGRPGRLRAAGVLVACGGAAAVAAVIAKGLAFAPPAWLGGVVAGVFALLAWRAWWSAAAPAGEESGVLPDPSLAAAVLCMWLAHVLETGLTGIATTTSLTLGWAGIGMLAALAPRARPDEVAPDAVAPSPGAWGMGTVLIGGITTAMVLATLLQAFVTTGRAGLVLPHAGIAQAAGAIPEWAGLAALFGSTCVAGAWLATRASPPLPARPAVMAGALAIALVLAFAAVHVTGLQALGGLAAGGDPGTRVALEGRTFLLTGSYLVAIGVLVAALAACLPIPPGPARRASAAGVALLVVLGPIVAFALAGVVAPVHADIVTRLGEEAGARGDWSAAATHYSHALALQPREDRLAMALADAHLQVAGLATDATARAAALDSAEAALALAGSLGPHDPDYATQAGQLHWLRAAEATDPAQRRVHLQRTAEAFARATALSPRRASAWNDRARVALAGADAGSSTDDGEVDTFLARSLELDARFAPTYLLRARALARRGQLEPARADAERALALDPWLAEAWQVRAALARTPGDRVALEALARQHLLARPDLLPALRVVVADVTVPLGRFAEAVVFQRRVVAQAASPGEAALERFTLAMLLAQDGQPEAAVVQARSALQGLAPERQAEARAFIEAITAQAVPAP